MHIILAVNGKKDDIEKFEQMLSSQLFKCYDDHQEREISFTPVVHELKLYNIVIPKNGKSQFYKWLGDNFGGSRLNSYFNKIKRWIRTLMGVNTVEKILRPRVRQLPDLDLDIVAEIEDPLLKTGAEGI